ncbi:MAG: hypothetical protein D5R98_06020 [Desulfonatronovibrio sp. MSAO_Bac4]|nr:MAG: hypothetical protein D5R98_06020 [Desulfonatronovibrio sp. MSAO_Bac4]
MNHRITSPQSNSVLKIVLPAAGIVFIVLIIGINLLTEKNKEFVDDEPILFEGNIDIENSSQETSKENTNTLPQKVKVFSEITGIVEYVSPELKPGQIIPEGNVLIQLNNTTQKVQLQRALTNADQAQSRLEYLERIAINAHQEWSTFQTRRYFDHDPLIHYEPYIIQARLELEEALAYADNARLNLEKTIFRASSISKIFSVNVSPGERVYPGKIIAVLTKLENNNSNSGQNNQDKDRLYSPNF